jgi:starch synthase
MRVLHVASEVYPLAKTGGLADVTAALPLAQRELGIDARILIPGYPNAIDRSSHPREVARFDNLLGCGAMRLLAATIPNTHIPVWLVDCPLLYDRASGIYQDADGNDWHDNALRFALLNHVAAEIAAGAAGIHWRPDVVHCHDWHAGLVPLLLAKREGQQPLSVLTIHNLAYQGLFAPGHFQNTGLPTDPETLAATEFYGRRSYLKGGIVAACALTTVSPTYAKEILTPEFGCGLDGLLRIRADSLTGIMNGVDYNIWDPASDPYITHHYSACDVTPKQACKAAIQEEMGLEVSADTPLVAFMSRLAHQKMPDIVLEAIPTLLAHGIQFALVAEGASEYESGFRELSSQYPGRAFARINYDERLTHQLLAGADILLHPSRFEPCGLLPIYAMRYGTLPIVRRIGGTADSVVDTTAWTIHDNIATGFSFEPPVADELIACVIRALSIYRLPPIWRKIQTCAMRQDFGWERPARAYVELYRSVEMPVCTKNSIRLDARQRRDNLAA